MGGGSALDPFFASSAVPGPGATVDITTRAGANVITRATALITTRGRAE
jgi:hypothetical protein